jgi:hypothetical protein
MEILDYGLTPQKSMASVQISKIRTKSASGHNLWQNDDSM